MKRNAAIQCSGMVGKAWYVKDLNGNVFVPVLPNESLMSDERLESPCGCYFTTKDGPVNGYDESMPVLDHGSICPNHYVNFTVTYKDTAWADGKMSPVDILYKAWRDGQVMFFQRIDVSL